VVSSNKIIEDRDPTTGQVKEVITLASSDPDPHGAAIHNEFIYLCDVASALARRARVVILAMSSESSYRLALLRLAVSRSPFVCV
jgi:hypothetical protein